MKTLALLIAIFFQFNIYANPAQNDVKTSKFTLSDFPFSNLNWNFNQGELFVHWHNEDKQVGVMYGDGAGWEYISSIDKKITIIRLPPIGKKQALEKLAGITKNSESSYSGLTSWARAWVDAFYEETKKLSECDNIPKAKFSQTVQFLMTLDPGIRFYVMNTKKFKELRSSMSFFLGALGLEREIPGHMRFMLSNLRLYGSDWGGAGGSVLEFTQDGKVTKTSFYGDRRGRFWIDGTKVNIEFNEYTEQSKGGAPRLPWHQLKQSEKKSLDLLRGKMGDVYYTDTIQGLCDA